MSWRAKFRHLGTVISDTRWWPFYLQRRVTNPMHRKKIADLLSRIRPYWRSANPASIPLNTSTALAALNTEGLVPLGPLLTVDACRAAIAHFKQCGVEDPYRPEAGRFLPGDAGRPQGTHVAYHSARDVLAAPGLLTLANEPGLLDVAAQFLGCKPTIAYMAAWWSYYTGLGAQHAEQFHRDVDDWRFLKLFVYLTDVGPDNGPHTYVTTSATSDLLTAIRRWTDQDVISVYGSSNVHSLTGKAGEGFFENTFGIHKGQPIISGERLIFQVVYSMFELPYGPRRPVSAFAPDREGIPTNLDPWINRVYLNPMSSGNQFSGTGAC